MDFAKHIWIAVFIVAYVLVDGVLMSVYMELLDLIDAICL